MNNTAPEGWLFKPLGEAISHLIDFRGRTPKKLGMEWGGGNIRALSANNVQMGHVDFSKECYLASEQLYENWMTKGDAAKNDVLFTMEAPLGNVALVPDDKKYILSQRVILMKAKAGTATPNFLFQQLRSDQFQRQLAENSTGSTAVGIQQKRLIQLELVLPPIPEQQKIAAILSSVDDVIEKTRAQIDKLKDLKTGMMQELLTKGIGAGGVPHTEFKDSPLGRIPAGWDVVTVGDVATKVVDGPHKTPKYLNQGVPFITVKNMITGRLIFTNHKYISEEDHQEFIKRGKAEVGDILYSKDGSIGQTCVVRTEREFSYFVSVALIKLKKESFLPDFMNIVLQSDATWRQVDLMSEGSGLKHMVLRSIKALKVPLPPIEEQRELTKIIDSVSDMIDRCSITLMNLGNLKKALMQDLLTGKVRVNVNVDQKESAVA